jgi:MoxR-like ATPase
MMNLVSELSAWETELANLRTEVKILREAKVLTDFELDQLRRRNAILEEKVEYHLTRHVRLKTQLDRTGADLVQAIQAYTQDDERDNITHDTVAQLTNNP